jgi:hypothetical protein
MIKHIFFATIVIAISMVAFHVQADPSVGIEVAMNQVNGGSAEARSMFQTQTFRANTPMYAGVAIFLTAAMFYGRQLIKFVKSFS